MECKAATNKIVEMRNRVLVRFMVIDSFLFIEYSRVLLSFSQIYITSIAHKLHQSFRGSHLRDHTGITNPSNTFRFNIVYLPKEMSSHALGPLKCRRWQGSVSQLSCELSMKTPMFFGGYLRQSYSILGMQDRSGELPVSFSMSVSIYLFIQT